MRDPKRIDPFLYELGRIWKAVETDLRFGQFIENFKSAIRANDLFFIEDNQMLHDLKDVYIKPKALDYFWEINDKCRFCNLERDCPKRITGYNEPIYPPCVEDEDEWAEKNADTNSMIDEYLDIREEEGYE